MKKFITGMFLLMGLHGWGQIDTVFLSQEKLADTIYNGLQTKCPTGFLANKLSLLPSDSLLLKTSLFSGDSAVKHADADAMMRWLYETNNIAVQPNELPIMDSVLARSCEYAGEMEFEHEIIIIPIGIFDLTFNSVDEETGFTTGILTKEISIWKDQMPTDNSIVSTHHSSLAGPLFDYFSSDRMGFIIKSEFFVSNTRTADDVIDLTFIRNGVERKTDFDQMVFFRPYYDSLQYFKLRVTYSDSSFTVFNFMLHTQEIIEEKSLEKGLPYPEDWDGDPDDYLSNCSLFEFPWNPGCKDCGTMQDDNGNKIKWCFIPSCSREGYDDEQPEKPYILVTGYRPPMFGQSFKKSWKIYNTNHASLLQNLRGQDYDIIIVKFNIAGKPMLHGMEESAALFERFLNHLNQNMKKGDYFENIIQGSSMGEEIVRLALLRMEKKHMDYNQNYPHHHSRLNIAYDANFFGANIPLGYQYQVYSAHWYKSNYFGIIPLFLSGFLYNTVNQKSFKELVAYHAASYNDNIFTNPNQNIGYTVPTYHWRRQGFLNALDAADNHEHIFPIPVATRNIAISLGKISGKNSDNDERYNNAGEYWQNYSFLGYRFRVGTAKYMPPGQTFQIFRRQYPSLFLNPFQAGCKHEVNVSQMLEIDNVSGSFMNKIGNFVEVADWAYFAITQIWTGRNRYSHKSVVTALGINPNLWPSDGSMTVNVKDLKLMFNQFGFDINDPNDYSNNYGYPNLGRPNDHFQVTPFEAIYIDNSIDPHIDMSGGGNEVDKLNDFIYGEAEPWYLGLQNQVVGSRARLNYPYYVRRRARNIITVGHLVTPATDPGDYVTQENAEVDLRAGQEINLKPGVHFQSGSTVHLKIEFERCSQNMVDSRDSGIEEHNGTQRELQSEEPEKQGLKEKKQVRLYPNPSNDGTFVLQTEAGNVISGMRIFTTFGTLVDEVQENRTAIFRSNKQLPTGTYIIQVRLGNQVEIHKLVVL
ncbi:MAG: T9SS type A sorting domain-containing protein [Fluviicola sp.]